MQISKIAGNFLTISLSHSRNIYVCLLIYLIKVEHYADNLAKLFSYLLFALTYSMRVRLISLMSCSTLEMSMGYMMVMGSQILASLLSAIISIYVIIKCSRLSFHINCKILIYSMLWLYFTHSLAYGGPQAYQLFYFLTLPNLCYFGIPVNICLAVRVVSMLCMTSYASLQLAMVIERCIALWKCRVYETFNMKLGLCFAIISVGASFAATMWTLQSEISLDLKPSCYSTTKPTVERMFTLSFILCGMNVGTLIALVTLYISNREGIKRRRYDLRSSYQLVENFSVIRLLLPLTVFHNICYAFLTFFGALLASISQRVDASIFRILFLLNYIVPYYTLICPLVIWSIIMYSQRLRAAKLSQLAKQKSGADDVYAYARVWM